jgi:hypothetical protein
MKFPDTDELVIASSFILASCTTWYLWSPNRGDVAVTAGAFVFFFVATLLFYALSNRE